MVVVQCQRNVPKSVVQVKNCCVSLFFLLNLFFDVPELYLLVPKQRHHVAKQETFNRSVLKADLVKT